MLRTPDIYIDIGNPPSTLHGVRSDIEKHIIMQMCNAILLARGSVGGYLIAGSGLLIDPCSLMSSWPGANTSLHGG